MSHKPDAQINKNGHGQGDFGSSEVLPKAQRRHFSAEYKRRILEEADACTERGQIGALLRREGLYTSHLDKWRTQRDRGRLAGTTDNRRGPTAQPEAAELARLRRENARLQARLQQAEAIIEVQKKVSQLLGLMPDSSPNDELR
jgi:transposase-like protein